MLHYFKFRQDLFDPQPARDVYIKRGPGKGWPEECPPIRAANAFGYDLLANFDITFTQTAPRRRQTQRRRGSDSPWRVTPDITIESDFHYSKTPEGHGAPLTQQYAWFWEKGQRLPHVITDNVYKHIDNQVKVSSYLFLQTDPNELLMMTDLPNLRRPFRALTAVVDTDWYPASYPWHVVLELDRNEKRITIKKGDPICRVIPLRRDAYFAAPMSPDHFDQFFERGQRWLATHGKFEHDAPAAAGAPVDITRTYVRQQLRSKFVVLK